MNNIPSYLCSDQSLPKIIFTQLFRELFLKFLTCFPTFDVSKSVSFTMFYFLLCFIVFVISC